MDCFVAEFIIGPAEGRTRWLLAMTVLHRIVFGSLKIESAIRARRASAIRISPCPACGERSKPKASGEGDYPRVRTWGESPFPNPPRASFARLAPASGASEFGKVGKEK